MPTSKLSACLLSLFMMIGSTSVFTGCASSERSQVSDREIVSSNPRSKRPSKYKKKRCMMRNRQMRKTVRARKAARQNRGFHRQKGDADLIQLGNRNRFGRSLDSW